MSVRELWVCEFVEYWGAYAPKNHISPANIWFFCWNFIEKKSICAIISSLTSLFDNARMSNSELNNLLTWKLVPFDITNTMQKIWNRLLHVKVHRKSWQNGSDPFISEKNVRIIGFMVFKSPGSDSRPARTHFGRYLRTTGIFFKPDFCIEIVSLSRSICKTMIPLLWTFFSFMSKGTNFQLSKSFGKNLIFLTHPIESVWRGWKRKRKKLDDGLRTGRGENQVWFVL